jgi:hypothetical protein
MAQRDVSIILSFTSIVSHLIIAKPLVEAVEEVDRTGVYPLIAV